MTTNKRKKIQSIDSYEFEAFVRIHLPKHLADTLLVDVGITSYSGFLQCYDLNGELLAAHDSLHEQNRELLFSYNNSLPVPSPIGLKKAVLRELLIFQEECKNKMNNGKINRTNSEQSSSSQAENDLNNVSKRLKTHYDTYRTVVCKTRANDTIEDDKFKYREKPITNEDSATDWSFNQEELDHETAFNDCKNFDDFIVKEATHIYVTQQRIHHFFCKNMCIKSEDIQKFVFLVQSKLEWHVEQLYEYTMKTRMIKALFDQFVGTYKNAHFENHDSLKKKVEWLVHFIHQTKYKPSGYNN